MWSYHCCTVSMPLNNNQPTKWNLMKSENLFVEFDHFTANQKFLKFHPFVWLLSNGYKNPGMEPVVWSNTITSFYFNGLLVFSKEKWQKSWIHNRKHLPARVSTMVLILDGYSDLGAHMYIEIGNLTWLRHWIRSRSVTNLVFLFLNVFSFTRANSFLSYHLI